MWWSTCWWGPIYESLLRRMTTKNRLQAIHRMDRLELPVYAGSVLDGMAVRDFKWPKETLLMAIRRGEDSLLPHGDTVIHGGDTLVILTDASRRAAVRKRLHELAEKNE